MLAKQAEDFTRQLTEASFALATQPSVPEQVTGLIERVRDSVAALTLSERDEVDPYLLDALQNGLLRAWQAETSGEDDAAYRRGMRVAVEQVRQALRDLAEDRPVSATAPAKDVARWLERILDVSHDDIAGLLGVSRRTFDRWVAEQGTEPSGGEEFRLRQLTRAVSHLHHSFTGPGVVAWMRRPHPQLDGRAPVDLLDDPEQAAVLVSLAASTRASVAA